MGTVYILIKTFEKASKILSLKYLGFSLDDIFAMTANDSYLSLKQSLDLQMKLIQQKIETLQSMQSFFTGSTKYSHSQ